MRKSAAHPVGWRSLRVLRDSRQKSNDKQESRAGASDGAGKECVQGARIRGRSALKAGTYRPAHSKDEEWRKPLFSLDGASLKQRRSQER
jgi:hypothetical protein